jgi:simple sugar transport system ATP-binding protein
MEKRNQGKAVLLVSYDLDEIIKLSDRIVVMYEGALIEVPYGETDAKAIGRIMVGFYENKTEARIE